MGTAYIPQQPEDQKGGLSEGIRAWSFIHCFDADVKKTGRPVKPILIIPKGFFW